MLVWLENRMWISVCLPSQWELERVVRDEAEEIF